MLTLDHEREITERLLQDLKKYLQAELFYVIICTSLKLLLNRFIYNYTTNHSFEHEKSSIFFVIILHK